MQVNQGPGQSSSTTSIQAGTYQYGSKPEFPQPNFAFDTKQYTAAPGQQV